MANYSTRETGTAPVKTGTEARQGRYGKTVLYVLIAGLILAAIALVLIVGFTGVGAPPPSIGASPGPVGPSTDAVPGNAEPSRLDAAPKPGR